MRILPFILCVSLLSAQCYAKEPYKALVTKTWTVDTARIEALKNAPPSIDVSGYSSIDPNLTEHRQAISEGKKIYGMWMLTTFNDGTYSVGTLDNPNDAGLHYSASGQLLDLQFEILEQDKKQRIIDALKTGVKDFGYLLYPLKTYTYLYPSGDLETVGIEVGPNNSYVFSPSGELLTHWLNDKCYYLDGTSCGSRETTTFINGRAHKLKPTP